MLTTPPQSATTAALPAARYRQDHTARSYPSWIMTRAFFALLAATLSTVVGSGFAHAETVEHSVANEVIADQRAELGKNTEGAGFGPQAPRDIDQVNGGNARSFEAAPPRSEMNLCNIHFHENAEHRGGNFTTYAGNGDGEGYGTGFQYDGRLSAAELVPYPRLVGASEHGDLAPGDTIEVHFVHTTAQVVPGPTLGSCLSPAINNPQLRVEAQVLVLVNDNEALDFTQMALVAEEGGLYQAPNIPDDAGTPVEYAGSTTGPSYNETGSPFQVTWNVRPQVLKVSIASVEAWLADNIFDEDHAHGVRNLVRNPFLLSQIE